jgi:NAD(P)-dependent dehydrogenase (short-subunit alcohol dehydrogenase family)
MDLGLTGIIAVVYAARQRFLARIPAGHFGRPEECTPAVLASQRASLISGSSLVFDGAQTSVVM